MNIKIKDIISLKGCYSAYDVGEKEIEIPSSVDIERILIKKIHGSWAYKSEIAKASNEVASMFYDFLKRQARREKKDDC